MNIRAEKKSRYQYHIFHLQEKVVALWSPLYFCPSSSQFPFCESGFIEAAVILRQLEQIADCPKIEYVPKNKFQ